MRADHRQTPEVLRVPTRHHRLGLRSARVRFDRSHPALPHGVHPSRASQVQRVEGRTGRQAGEGRLPAARRWAGASCSSARIDDDLVIFMSDHGHQACTRTCTMDRILQTPRVSGVRQGVLRFQPDPLGARPAHRPPSVRHLQVARKDLDPGITDRVVEDARVHERRLDRRGRVGEPERAGARRDRRSEGLRESPGRGRGLPRSAFRDPETGDAPDLEDLPEGRGAVREASSTSPRTFCWCRPPSIH